MKKFYYALITTLFSYGLIWAQEWQTNGDNIYNINTGNVGIGTGIAALYHKVQIAGNLRLGDNINYTDITLQSAVPNTYPGYNGTFEILPTTIPGSGIAKFATYFKTAGGGNYGSTRHDVIIDGYLGIGTVLPYATLHVNGSVRFSNITQNNALTRVLVEDAEGDIHWREVASLGDGVDDADADPDNEVNTNLALNGTALQITDSNGTLSQDLDGTFATDAELAALNIDDADASTTNELLISAILNDTNLELTDAGGTTSVDLSLLSDGTGTDDQMLSLTGNNLQLEDGGNVDLSVYMDNTDNQDLPSVLSQGNNANGNNLVNIGSIGIGTDMPAAALDVIGTVKIGDVTVATPGAGIDYNLYVQNGILTEKVRVAGSNTAEWSWPDYVFEEDYKLRPLEEVEIFIAKNKHLPGIPSAEKVAREGIDLAQINTKLLEKIEELTLYTIQQQKLIEVQAKQNTQQKQVFETQIAQQQKLIAQLLKRITTMENQ